MATIIQMEFGSKLYGTKVATSDTDIKSIFLPDFRDIILQRPPRVTRFNTKESDSSKNLADDIDVENFSLHHWLKLFTEGQTVCYDMLFAPEKHWIGKPTKEWETIIANKDRLVNSKITSFAGYCQAQAAKYSLKGSNLAAYTQVIEFFKTKPNQIKIAMYQDEIDELLIKPAQNDMKYSDKPEAIIKIVIIPHKITGTPEKYLQVGPKTKVPFNARCGLAVEVFEHQVRQYGERAKQAKSNEGVDWKALMHAVRVCKEAQELLLTGNITFPRPEKDLLLQIRKGELDYSHVAELIVSGLDELNGAKEKSTLRDKPDYKWIEDFIFDTYKELK